MKKHASIRRIEETSSTHSARAGSRRARARTAAGFYLGCSLHALLTTRDTLATRPAYEGDEQLRILKYFKVLLLLRSI